ncbi:hypothetical protein EMCRGX_G002726 [Ephydatia muelleri]
MSYTTDFADLVQLCVDLGATNLSYLYKGENAKCTSQRTVQEFVECMADVVEEDVLKKFRASVSAGLMLDESTDISVRKELATCVKIQCDGITETKCLNIAEIPDGTADTIVATTTQYFTDAAVPFDKITSLTKDGAAVMMGHYYYDTGLRGSATHTALVTAPNCDPISAIDVISEDITGPEAPKHYQQTSSDRSHRQSPTSWDITQPQRESYSL